MPWKCLALLVFIILVGLPLAEIAIFIETGGIIGAWPVVGLVALSALAGIWLMQLQGPATLRRAQAALQRGEPPVAEMLDGAILFVAALLMVTPGFLTSAFGMLLLIAPLRRLAARVAARRMAKRAHVHVHRAHMRPGPGGPIIEAEDWEVAPDESPGGDPASRRLPPGRRDD